MSNINWNQFLSNFASNVNRPANVMPEEPMPLDTAIIKQTPVETRVQNFFPGASAQFAQTAAELAALNKDQTAQMLKELLNMPKDLEGLLSRIAVNNNASNLKTAMFLLNSTLDIMKLSAMLQDTSRNASTNLYKMLAELNQVGMSLKDEQVSMLTKMISTVSSSSNSDAQSLKTMMLLYLPWLPLTDPDAFKWEISKKGGGAGGANTDSVTILISTERFGNLQAVITKTDQDSIKTEVVSSKTFPRDELVSLMKEESKKYNVHISCSTSVKSEFDKEKAKTSKTKVFINSAPGVNPFLILMSGALVRHVHALDEKERLKEERKEMLG